MIPFHIDPHSGLPIYRQVMDQVKYAAASGVLSAGDRLPSIRELARSLSVNPTTIVKAYGELAREGVVEIKHGRGVFVAGRRGEVSKAVRDEAMRRLVRNFLFEAARIGADTAEIIKHIESEIGSLTAEDKDE